MLASLLFPYDDDAKRLMDKWLAELEKERCIIRYAVGGDSYVQVCGWSTHQKIDKPSASKLPNPPEDSRTLATIREPSPLDQGGEGNGMDQGEDGESAATSAPPAVLIPLIDKTEYPVPQSKVDDWQVTYPAVNVLQQLREMRTWAAANPTKRKTPRGIEAFIVRWLGAEQDKGGKPRFGEGVVGVTTPGPTGPDPALVKLAADALRATAPSPEQRKRFAELTGKVH